MRVRQLRLLAVWATAALALGACGTAASPSVGVGTAASPSVGVGPTTSASLPSASPTALSGTKTFSVGGVAAGIDFGPMLAAFDDLRHEGYTITDTLLDKSTLVTEGVANGTFAFGSGSTTSLMTAVEKGANLKVLFNRANDDWALWARDDIADCSALAGKKLGNAAQGSMPLALVTSWINSKCPGTKPIPVVITASTARLQALLANQLDATPLELADSITLVAKAPTGFHPLANFTTDLPDVQTTVVYVNGDFAKQNPGTVLAVVEATLKEFRKVDGNPDYLKQIALQYTKEAVDTSTIDAVAKAYVDNKLFPVNGGLTQQNLSATATFAGPAPAGTGATTAVMAVDQFADLSYLQMALSDLGTK